MNKSITKITKTKKRIRSKIEGTSERPRLSIFRSNNHIYAQIIDDSKRKTLLAASTLDKDIMKGLTSTSTCEASEKVGAYIAVKSLENKIDSVVFDRGGHVYHGRIKALATAARENGLKF
jgi:large subunit ribosomal protein L18